jgi:hypothetical protein
MAAAGFYCRRRQSQPRPQYAKGSANHPGGSYDIFGV